MRAQQPGAPFLIYREKTDMQPPACKDEISWVRGEGHVSVEGGGLTWVSLDFEEGLVFRGNNRVYFFVLIYNACKRGS